MRVILRAEVMTMYRMININLGSFCRECSRFTEEYLLSGLPSHERGWASGEVNLRIEHSGFWYFFIKSTLHLKIMGENFRGWVRFVEECLR